jgi:hypothetical protein
VFKDFHIGRASPIWLVKKGAMKPNNRLSRLCELSKPKQLHPDYKPCKSIISEVTPGALGAACSSRVESLSEPKKRVEPPPRLWNIAKSSLRANASERIEQLSHPRGHVPGFMADNFESWRVSRAAIGARPSNRLEELSKPMIREVATNLPRDNAFIVSMAALKAQCSDRISELSQPIKR